MYDFRLSRGWVFVVGHGEQLGQLRRLAQEFEAIP
jgi:hypothetical protein